MKILVITSVYPGLHDEKAITRTVQYFCEEWTKSGYEVRVIHTYSLFPKIYYYFSNVFREKISSLLGFTVPIFECNEDVLFELNGVLVNKMPVKKIVPHSLISEKDAKQCADAIIRILDNDRFKPDLILGHWVNPQYMIIKELKKYFKSRTSLVFHNDCTDRNIKKLNLKEMHNYIDAIGCRSEQYSKNVKGKLNLKRDPFICYSGVPDKDFDKYSDVLIEKNKGNDFLYVGRLVKYKNIDVIIEALSIAFPAKNFNLKIIGSGGELENIKSLISEKGLEKNVRILGRLPREKVFEHMRAASCFVMVSTGETFGMVYIEAMMCSCVTIATKGGGVDGVIQDGKNGFLVDDRNIEALSKLFQKISKMNPNIISQIRKNSVLTASNYKDSKVSDRYIKDIFTWDNRSDV